jgi:hypothetical protein
MAFSQARKILGPHLGALVVVALVKFITGEPPKFSHGEEEQ